MKGFLSGLKKRGATCTLEPYVDTKIRYLFSHFKIMVPSRRMCFEEQPYQCPQEGGTHGRREEL
jgi:hypothetical protein